MIVFNKLKTLIIGITQPDLFKNKAFSSFFGMDLSIDKKVLSTQIEGIIYRNI